MNASKAGSCQGNQRERTERLLGTRVTRSACSFFVVLPHSTRRVARGAGKGWRDAPRRESLHSLSVLARRNATPPLSSTHTTSCFSTATYTRRTHCTTPLGNSIVITVYWLWSVQALLCIGHSVQSVIFQPSSYSQPRVMATMWSVRLLCLLCAILTAFAEKKPTGRVNVHVEQHDILFTQDPRQRNPIGGPCRNSGHCEETLCCQMGKDRRQTCQPMALIGEDCTDGQVKGGAYPFNCPCLQGICSLRRDRRHHRGDNGVCIAQRQGQQRDISRQQHRSNP